MHRFLGSLALCLTVMTSASAEPMTDRERERLLAHLDMTEAWLASEVAGLSKAQLTFRSAPDTWSVMDVVEHLAVAEGQYWTRVQDSMRQPPTTEKLEATDADILWYGIDRTNRQRTGEARVPKGRWDDVRASLAEFARQRTAMRAYAAETKDDLRAHKLLEGNMSVYQWLLMISTHAQRHILQVREIKAHGSFPKS